MTYPRVTIHQTGAAAYTVPCAHPAHARKVAHEALSQFQDAHPVVRRTYENDGWRWREVLRDGRMVCEVVVEFGPAPEVKVPEPVPVGVGAGDLWG